MFNEIPKSILERMKYLEEIDTQNRSGGIIVADNAINHEETLRPMLDRAPTDNRVDALIVPIGKGKLVCRKI